MLAEPRLLIRGEWVTPGQSGYEVINPATEQVVGEAPGSSVADAEAACSAAADAFGGAWARTTPEHRADLLTRFADLLDKRRDEFVPLVQAETGATLRVTKQMQVPMAATRFRRYAQVESNLVPLPPSVMPTTALAPGGIIGAVGHRAPVGVVACITSYNFPMTNMAGKLAPALAMGNTVVVKPAWQDPLAVIQMCELFDEAGFPPGVVNIVSSPDPAPAEAIVASPHVDMISFTGSTAVGGRIAEVAGRGMKRLLLELGGKGSAVVFADADLAAVRAAVSSVWTFHSGQICTAPTRLIAHRSVYDEVVGRLAAMAGALKVGDPLERDTVLGPVITAAHRDGVEAHVAAAVADGATAVAGGLRPDIDTGFYVAPTLLAACRIDMAAVQEEIFGPVVVAIPFDDDDEAVALANGTRYGLYDYVFSADTSRAMGVAKQLRSGSVGINTVQRNHEAAFGGFKHSGVGRDGGSWGLHAYSEMQSIVWSG
ncbi:MAG: aldehyde dehydrogenase family protein [Acidimicrobiales bacterium]